LSTGCLLSVPDSKLPERLIILLKDLLDEVELFAKLVVAEVVVAEVIVAEVAVAELLVGELLLEVVEKLLLEMALVEEPNFGLYYRLMILELI
jgi:hypothetical protein